MTYLDLLCTPKYFDVFLEHFNSTYGKKTVSASSTEVMIRLPNGTTQKDLNKFSQWLARRAKRTGEEREPHYGNLIKRYYGLDQGARGAAAVGSSRVAALIGNPTHIQDVYESLRRDFMMERRGSRLLPLEEVSDSIEAHKDILIKLSQHRMESIAPDAIPEELLDGLKLLFSGLKVVPLKAKPGKPPKEGPKLVAVSKILHFLLPDLVMPVDRKKVLRFFRKGDVPQETDEQFELFMEVFRKYAEVTARLGLTSGNGDGNWWNISVPKRIDNAILGFWDIFDDANLERIICGHTDMLLEYLGALRSEK